jgi:hypothetical protein
MGIDVTSLAGDLQRVNRSIYCKPKLEKVLQKSERKFAVDF